jgi:hypothetical protein
MESEINFSTLLKDISLFTYNKTPTRGVSTISKLEKHRSIITKRIISGTITRMRKFDMYGKVKPKKLKIVEFAIVDDNKLYRFGGFTDSE